jgi:hypothetical protein
LNKQRLNDLLTRLILTSLLGVRRVIRGPRYLNTQVLFFPEYPAGFNYVVWKFIRYCGVTYRPLSRIHLEEVSESIVYRQLLKLFNFKPISNRTFIYAYEDNTRNVVDVSNYIEAMDRLSKERKYYFINAGCSDISKQAVSKWMLQVFGYSTMVDPLKYEARMVVKSDTNGIHDGTVVQGPLACKDIEADSVYQIIVDNSVATNRVEDLRLVLVGDQIPVLYRKQRPLDQRFSNTNTIVYLDDPEQYFSADELRKIIEFRRASNIDICELDVLRDKKDKRIYIVDVNRTVSGPPNHLGLANTIRAVARIANAFEGEFLQSSRYLS